MNKKSHSQPKFKQVYTSRIKDGRYSNDEKPMVNNFMSARKIKHQDNPQSAKKINSKPPQKFEQDHKKYGTNFMQTAADSPVKKLADQEPPKIKFQERKQETFNGRKLQYPHPTYRKGGSTNNQDQPKLQRAQSATYTSNSSRHYVDRSKRSRELQERQATDDEKVKIALNYLFQNNEEYLAERVRMCNQKARPKEQIFKINLAKTPSTYKNDYPPKQAPYEIQMEPQNEKTANSFAQNKVCGNSTNNQVHNGRQGPKADLSTWPDGFKLQGPIDGTTTYGNKFPDYGDYEKMVPIATFNEHPMGFPHTTNSTHRTFFDGKTCNPSDIAKWNNLHPYGNDFNPDRGTQYGQKHSSKVKHDIQQWPNYDPRLIVSKGKFSTEYKDRIRNEYMHELNEENRCKCGKCGRQGKKRIYK